VDSVTPRIAFAQHLIYAESKPAKAMFNLYRKEVLDENDKVIYPLVQTEQESITGIYFGYTLGLCKKESENVTIESTHSFSRDYANANGLIELVKVVESDI
jgi:hypothetical protein